ncbi:hypothetical protein [Enterococcus phage PEF1]
MVLDITYKLILNRMSFLFTKSVDLHNITCYSGVR